MGQIPIPSSTGFTLILNSRGASGVHHPRKTKQRFRQGWQNCGIRMQNVMDDTECRDVHPYDMVIQKLPYIYIPSVIHTIHSLVQAQAEVQLW